MVTGRGPRRPGCRSTRRVIQGRAPSCAARPSALVPAPGREDRPVRRGLAIPRPALAAGSAGSGAGAQRRPPGPRRRSRRRRRRPGPGERPAPAAGQKAGRARQRRARRSRSTPIGWRRCARKVWSSSPATSSPRRTTRRSTPTGWRSTWTTRASAILRMISTGNVRIITEDCRTGTARRAEYYDADQRIILIGNARVWQDENVVTGERSRSSSPRTAAWSRAAAGAREGGLLPQREEAEGRGAASRWPCN